MTRISSSSFRILIKSVWLLSFGFIFTLANAQNNSFEHGSKSRKSDVELVISSGISYGYINAFSPDNHYFMTGMLKNFAVWDVKSGRKIREITIPQNNVMFSPDTIWFDSKEEAHIHLMSTNDYYLANIRTGEITYQKSPEPYDYSKALQVKNNHYKLQMYLDSASMKEKVIPTGNEKYAVVLRKIKFKKVNLYGKKQAFVIELERNRKRKSTLDTLFYISGMTFSKDGRFFYANNKIFDLEKQHRVSSFKLIPYSGTGVAFLPGTHIPVTAGIGNVVIWDFPKVRTLPVSNLADIVAFPGYKKFLLWQHNQKPAEHKIFTYDLITNQITDSFSVPNQSMVMGNVSEDGKRLAVRSYPMDKNGKMSMTGQIYNLETGKVLKDFTKTNSLMLTPDPNKIILDSASGFTMMYNLKNKQFESILIDKNDPAAKYYRPYPYGISNDNRFVFSSISDAQSYNAETKEMHSKIIVWDLKENKEYFSVRKVGTAYGYETNADQTLFAVGISNDIFVYNMKTGKELFQFKGHLGYVMKMAFSDDNKRLISSSMDGTRKIWNLENGEEMVSLVATGEDDYAIVTPDQYYYATKGATNSIHFVKGLKIFPFEQFDLKYNRPDVILKSLAYANTDPNLIRSYNLAYQKRLKKSGFTEAMLSGEFHMPEASVTNMASLDVVTSKPAVQLSVQANDSKYNLDRIIVRVNGVPLNGMNGFSYRGKNKQSVEKNIPLKLSTGLNKITVSSMNEKGVESIGEYLEMTYQPAVPSKPNLYLITLGVSHYSASEYDLKYASKDAADFTHLFEGQHAPFDKVITHNLVDEQVNLEEIAKLKSELMKNNVDDAVCIFFAGHGVLDEQLNYYLASSKIAFNDPSKGGIPYESLEDLLDGIPSRHKVMLIDACHSGEIDKDEVVIAKKQSVVNEDVTFRSVGGNSVKTVGLSNSFELMKELFADLRKSNGSIVISSAGGTEFAMEGDQWKNGVFTYSLLHGLKSGEADLNHDNRVMMSEINKYIREEVERLTNGRQHPTNRLETLEVDWRLW